jgi:heme exporter protein A
MVLGGGLKSHQPASVHKTWEQPLLQAAGLAAFRGERVVFHQLTFEVAAGGAMLLTGPNGAGKSTLLRVLAGLLRPAAGKLAWDGADALADLPLHARRVAYVGHQDAVKPGFTAAENLHFADNGGGGVKEALAAMGLGELAEIPTRILSAGQRRRLALSRLALADRPLWLLDEPTLGLDALSEERLYRMLAAHRARGGIVIAATHLPLPLPDAMKLSLP